MPSVPVAALFSPVSWSIARFAPSQRFQRLRHLFLLLLDQIGFHGIIVVMFAHDALQFDLLLDLGALPPCFLLVLTGALQCPPSLPAALIFAIRLVRIIQKFFVADGFNFTLFLLVARVVDAHHSAENSGAAEVVDREVAAALILVLKEAESSTFARLLVSHQIDVHGVAILAEDDQDVSLAQFKRQTTDVDVGCVAIICVPGCV